jgi:hypothetical protein
MLWIEVLIPNFKLLVCVVYRPPGTTASFWDNFDYSLRAFKWKTENSYSWGPGFWWISLSKINNSKRIKVNWIFVEKGKWQVCAIIRVKFGK